MRLFPPCPTRRDKLQACDALLGPPTRWERILTTVRAEEGPGLRIDGSPHAFASKLSRLGQGPGTPPRLEGHRHSREEAGASRRPARDRETPYFQLVATFSTAHLRKEDASVLDAKARTVEASYLTTVFKYPEGYVVYLPERFKAARDLRVEEQLVFFDGYSVELADLLAGCYQQNVQ